MRKFLTQLVGFRLQYILVIGFVLTAAITVAVGTSVTYSLINNYLEDAQDARVGRDMELAEAFYNSKLSDISSAARRIASARNVRHNVTAGSHGDEHALQSIEDGIHNEFSNLPSSAQRFIVVTDPQGNSIAGQVFSGGRLEPATTGMNWSSLPIVQSVLTHGQQEAATEIVPADILAHVGLDQRAQITLLDTPKAAPEPFDSREGTAGLSLISVAPILSTDGEMLGSVLVGHLFNNDFTLVDRIKAVAGVDTATIFYGDLRVSTNVEDETGNRAIGTRVSQEVFDQVLLGGEEYTGPAYVVNQWYITRYEPLYDHLGQTVGMLYVGAKQAAFQLLVDSFRRRVYLIGGASILLAILVAIPLAWSISRPQQALLEELTTAFDTMLKTLEETQEQLIEKEKLASVGQLAAGVAHEINNPLGSVLLYADILRRETPDDNAQQQQDLDMIVNEATRCKTIVNDLLNFSRQNEVLAQDTDLNALLQELAEELRIQDLFQQIELVTELDPDLQPIQADPLQLRQIFLNLINNSAEAMPDGGKLTLRTRKGPAPGFVTVEVEDTGVGIPEANMNKLFTPFFTTKPIGKGTGLGLAIIYGIVKMHRGQINVQSTVGEGTTFSIALREKLPAQGEKPEGRFVLQ